MKIARRLVGFLQVPREIPHILLLRVSTAKAVTERDIEGWLEETWRPEQRMPTNLKNTPTMGNGIRITAGAKVFDDITIGDSSVIEANAVVFKDVPPNCIVGGLPPILPDAMARKQESLYERSAEWGYLSP